MANRFARKAGNWNATDVWSDTAAGVAGAEFIPGAGDVAHANSFAITINVNATCSQVRTDNANGATTAGTFTINDGITLTAAVIAGTAIAVTLASGSATIVGDVTGGSGSSIYGCRNTGTGTLTVTGNVTGGSNSAAHGAHLNTAGTIAISGNATGGSSTGSGAFNAGAGSITIGGDAVGGAGGIGANNASTGSITLAGDAIGAGNYGLQNAAAGVVTVTGDAIGSSTTALIYGVWISGTGTVTIDGAVRCGTVAAGVGGDDVGLCLVGGPLYRKSTAEGGDSYRQPISCEKWAFKAASTSQYEVGLHSSGTLVTFEATEAPVIVTADLMSRLAAVATVATTGAQIAALGPVA
jgi:hypothetical protein